MIDKSVTSILDRERLLESMMKSIAVEYQVPHHSDPKMREELALRLMQPGFSDKGFANASSQIESLFHADNKGMNPSVQEKIDDTIGFLEYCMKS